MKQLPDIMFRNGKEGNKIKVVYWKNGKQKHIYIENIDRLKILWVI